MRGEKIHPDVIDRMVELYVSGSTVPMVVSLLGLSGVTVRKYLRLRGVYQPLRDIMSPYPTPKLDDRQIDAVVQRYQDEATISEIAEALHVSYGYARNLLLSRGVSLRGRGRRSAPGCELGEGEGR